MKKKLPALLFSILLISLTIFFIASCSENNPSVTTGSVSASETTQEIIAGDDFEIEGTVLKKYKGSDAVVSVPDRIKSIATYAFTNSGVKTVILSGSVESVDRYAFFNCETLENLTINSGCKEISTGAFIGCSGLKSVTFADSKDWNVSLQANGENSTVVNVSDPTENASMLTGKYMTYFWFKDSGHTETTSDIQTTTIKETETVTETVTKPTS